MLEKDSILVSDKQKNVGENKSVIFHQNGTFRQMLKIPFPIKGPFVLTKSSSFK